MPCVGWWSLAREETEVKGYDPKVINRNAKNNQDIGASDELFAPVDAKGCEVG